MGSHTDYSSTRSHDVKAGGKKTEQTCNTEAECLLILSSVSPKETPFTCTAFL